MIGWVALQGHRSITKEKKRTCKVNKSVTWCDVPVLCYLVQLELLDRGVPLQKGVQVGDHSYLTLDALQGHLEHPESAAIYIHLDLHGHCLSYVGVTGAIYGIPGDSETANSPIDNMK